MAKAPLAKLPLAAKKDLRDNWDNKKEDIAQQISKIFGTTWTFEVDPLAVHAYADASNNDAGQTICKYFEQAIPKAKEYIDKHGDDGKKELNDKAFKHVLSLSHDDTGKINYCACDITDGVLRMMFKDSYYGSYCGDALSYLGDAVEKAPQPAGTTNPLSFYSRQSIKNDYDARIAEIQKEIGRLTGIPDIKLTPNFEANVATLTKENASGEWQKEIGDVTYKYFKGVADALKELKFGEDELLREGLQEALTAKEIKVQALTKLAGGGNYNEADVGKDGVLYINSTVNYWGSYVADPARSIVDKL